MILLLDLGNSRIKWALVEQRQWLASGAANTIDDLIAVWAKIAPPSRVLACSVAAESLRNAVAAELRRRWGLDCLWLQPRAQQLGVRNHYVDPSRLGADRWAAILGAHARQPGIAQVVVSAGTALVVDALSASGDYLGGMILPGYRLMKESLAAGTAQLPLSTGQVIDFPRSTADAIESGCLSAMAGAISAMFARLQAAEQTEVQILLSGGDAAKIAPLLNGKVACVDNLVLHGLEALVTVNGDESQ